MINYNDESVRIKKSGEYLVLVDKLSDYINGLPLSHQENERLIELILKQTEQATADSFIQGFKTATKVLQA